jgi:hypothetical protein
VPCAPCTTCSARISRNCIGVEEDFLACTLCRFHKSAQAAEFLCAMQVTQYIGFNCGIEAKYFFHVMCEEAMDSFCESHGCFLLCYCSLGLLNLPGRGRAYCKYTSLVPFIEICQTCAVIFKRSKIPEVDGSPHHTLES